MLKAPQPKRKAFPYLREMSGLFFLAAFSGWYLALLSPQGAAAVVGAVFSQFSYLSELAPFQLALFIFFNNSLKALAIMLLGMGFALVPLVFVFLNGQFLGLVAGAVGSERGYALVFLALLPHGLLEIPALLVAAGYGVFLGRALWLRIRHGRALLPDLKKALLAFLWIVLPALAAAALIEAYLSPLLVQLAL